MPHLLEQPFAFPGPDAAVARALTSAYALDVAHRTDPLLPRELLPRPWVGATARALLAWTWDRHELDRVNGG